MSTASGAWAGDLPLRGGWEILQKLKEQAEQTMGAQMHGRRGRGGPPGFGGPRFGPGPWMVGEWGGGPSRPRAAKGDVRLAILSLLWEAPRHGYQLIQDIAERSHGAWSPSPGSVYPALSALQDEGLIDDEKLEGRRVFSLTESGKRYAAEHADDIGAVFNSFSAEDEAGADLRKLMMGVGAAAFQVIAAGEGEQAQRILKRARRELYAVLAADGEED